MSCVRFLIVLSLFNPYNSSDSAINREMTLFVQSVRERDTKDINSYTLSSDATVTDLIELIIQRETSGIPRDILRASLSLEFSGIQITQKRTRSLSSLGVCSISVILYDTNLHHIDGALFHRQGWCLKKTVAEHIDLWFPCNPLQDISFWNSMKTQIRSYIAIHGDAHNLSPNVSTVFRFVYDDSSILEYAAATNCAYLWGHLPEWYGQYRITKGQNVYLMSTKRIKSQTKLQRKLHHVSIQRVIPSCDSNVANIVRKSLLSQLRSFKLHPASGRKEQVFPRNDINVWDSSPVESDYVSVRMIIPQGFDVLFDAEPRTDA